MAIKDLAVAYNASENADAALSLAVQMCAKYDAALTGIYALNPVRFEGRIERWLGDDVLTSLRQAERQAGGGIEAEFRERAADKGFTGPVHWVAEEGEPNQVLARRSRFHDILLMGQYSAAPASRRPVRAEDLVLRSGRPLAIVPHGQEVRPFEEYAVVAWDGSRPAARALSDAMQILETKRRLDVVTVVGGGDARAASSVPEVIEHLKRHGVDARPVALTAEREGVGATILRHCEEHRPDVLVMGAYGHAKLREDLFGGTTRHVLQNMRVPVMMSH